MNLELDGRVVLVTGGSDGLGRALCHRLVDEGARVALMARDPGRVDQVARALTVVGGDAVAVAGDVTVPADLERLVEAATGRWGRIDGVVNNAGQTAAVRLADSDDALWEQDFALKVLAAVRLTRLALPELKRSRGAVLNTLATLGKVPTAGSTPTSTMRAAGLSLTKALSRELGPDGIRVNAIVVGLVESGQWERRAAAAGIDAAAFYAQVTAGSDIPLGRVGRAEEFADLACYLLSARASYVSGTAVNIDGGLCAVT